MQRDPVYKEAVDRLRNKVDELTEGLAKNSTPFYSMRYLGHMNWDITLPGMVGYMAAVPFNPNNVAYESSPFTSELEIEVGRELTSLLFGEPSQGLEHWGHITCDGTVANIEAAWAARNLKYYPLAVQAAIKDDQGYLAGKDVFVELIDGSRKKMADATEWELLNLSADTILGLPTRIAEKHNLDSSEVSNAITRYSLQETGWWLNGKLLPQATIMVPATKHYSWPKAAALLGVGGSQCVSIPVDGSARMDLKEGLETKLEACLERKKPVLMVVAVIGSTAEGAVDDLKSILELRMAFRKRGLNFTVHADAAWGGYYKTMLQEPVEPAMVVPDPFVPAAVLSEHVATQLRALAGCDSVTIDPHKSGYIPYPAGFLGYNNRAMRDLLTYGAPIVAHGSTDREIGIFGVEGSKPGAAAAAVWLSHKVIPLDQSGYGQLLGQAMFTCRKVFARFVTLAQPRDNFIVEPVNALPTTVTWGDTTEDVTLEDIKKAAALTNRELSKGGKSAALLRLLGSDLGVNNYAVNFRIPISNRDPIINTDTHRANLLVKHIFKDMSISPGDGGTKPDVFMTQNVLDAQTYKPVVDRLKEKLHLKSDGSDLAVLINTVMNPWATTGGYLDTIGKELRRVIAANIAEPGVHGFVMVGGSRASENSEEGLVFLDHLPMFNDPGHRFQAIVVGRLSRAVMKQYLEAKNNNPDKPLILGNVAASKSVLDELVFHSPKGFQAECFVGMPGNGKKPFMTPRVEVVRIIRYTPFDPFAARTKSRRYVLFGDETATFMSKELLVGKDYHQVVEVKLKPRTVSAEELRDGITLSFSHMPTMDETGDVNLDDPFKEGQEYAAKTVGSEPSRDVAVIVTRRIWFDAEMINTKH